MPHTRLVLCCRGYSSNFATVFARYAFGISCEHAGPVRLGDGLWEVTLSLCMYQCSNLKFAGLSKGGVSFGHFTSGGELAVRGMSVFPKYHAQSMKQSIYGRQMMGVLGYHDEIIKVNVCVIEGLCVFGA
jgi:hypothetical protein